MCESVSIEKAFDLTASDKSEGYDSAFAGSAQKVRDDSKKDLTKTEDILAERANTHGSFHQVAEIAQLIKNVVRDETQALSCQQQEALDMIASKIARICNGNPDEPDHWRDISGYATLVADQLEGGKA